MVALQASIGALNDLVDVPLDAGRKPGKPIPRGRASRQEALVIAAAGLGVGLAASLPSGLPTTMVAAAGVACGYLYDLRLSRTAWSWLPLAIALPLVPIYAWLGATGALPGSLLLLVPIGVVAGSGLGLANGLADLERDQAAGVTTAAVRLGAARAWLAQAVLMVGAIAVAAIALPRGPGTGSAPGLAGFGLAGLGLAGGSALILVGLVVGRGGGPGLRERAWELEAVGTALVGAAWVAGVAVSG
jgi:4-hydroxybenzoate polyprenyltransferase